MTSATRTNARAKALDRKAADHYPALYRQFHWQVPDSFNIAEVCCTRWAGQPDRIAIYHEDEAGRAQTLTYAQMQEQANCLSNLLRALGVTAGARVAVALPQCPQTAVALMACLQMGVCAVPLTVLFGPDALQYRLQDSAALVAIGDAASLANLRQAAAQCPALTHVIAVDDGESADTAQSGNGAAIASAKYGKPHAKKTAGKYGGKDSEKYDKKDHGNGVEQAANTGPTVLDWDSALAAQPAQFAAAATRADDAALLIYTSGTTGPAKGALIPHRALIGNLPGFVASQNWFPQKGDVFWSPADWAWTGGLMDALLPTLYFGQPLVGYRGRFSAELAFHLLEKYKVTNTFLFPTALKIMMKAVPQPRARYRLHLRALMSAGEAVGDAVFHWCESALGVAPNEMFGQTEMNYIVGNSAQLWPARPGSMGRPYPGHRVAVIDEAGRPVKAGVTGEVALHRTDIHGDPDPIFFLGYCNNEQATNDKFSGHWCRTGDLALCDQDGYLWYQGRADDMFKAAGYRIGPAEIENCLLKHSAVLNAAVVPKPDRERGNLVKAYVVLRAGVNGDDALIAELQTHVRGKLAPYEYPKEIEFISALPMTTTGKLQRGILRKQEEQRAQTAGVAKA